jgi:hypothetical protein
LFIQPVFAVMSPAALKKKALDYHRLPKPGKLSV